VGVTARVVAAVAALALAAGTLAATSAGPLADAGSFLAKAQQPDGGFAEAGRASDPGLTAWAALGLTATRADGATRGAALAYLIAHEADTKSVTDLALVALARIALGDQPDTLLAGLREVKPGSLVNAEIWSILALRAAGEPAPPDVLHDLLAAQARSGGWSWARGARPDSNDTAAALEALRAAGVRGKPVQRGLAALATFRNRDGGYALSLGRESDAQSTAWAIQALAACGRRPLPATWRFLARLRRRDGSYRYTLRYGTTPVWVTAQVAPALAGRPYPLLP
jgi:iron complex transport system substrate-binding protein